MAVCPYEKIENEYRAIILNNEVRVAYSKQLPQVIGNGKDTILKLLAKSNEKYQINDFDQKIDFYNIPEHNEIFALNWKHNLGIGAVAHILEEEKTINELSILAKKATGLLNLKFASVDIIEVNGIYKILEINSGIMMENFANMNEDNYKLAKSIYKDAMFEN